MALPGLCSEGFSLKEGSVLGQAWIVVLALGFVLIALDLTALAFMQGQSSEYSIRYSTR
jgi:hypothetical protein